MPLVTHVAMGCEFSQIFLNLRNTIGKKATGLIPLVNNLCFLGSYTAFRMVLFPLLIVIHFKSTEHYDLWNRGEQRSTTFGHQACWVLLLSFFILVYLLNVYWYTLIIRGLLKFIKGDPTAGGAAEEIEEDKKGSKLHDDAAADSGSSSSSTETEKREKTD